jgi:hypothetical protein
LSIETTIVTLFRQSGGRAAEGVHVDIPFERPLQGGREPLRGRLGHRGKEKGVLVRVAVPAGENVDRVDDAVHLLLGE